MSDARLRELERRWQERGTLEDEIPLLQERVRIGDLDPERLKLAAWLGRDAARRLHDPEPLLADDPFLLLPAVEEREGDPLGLVDAFARDRAAALRRKLKRLPRGPFGPNLRKEIEARAELAALRSLNTDPRHGREERIQPVLEAAEEYLVARTVPNRKAAMDRVEDLDPEQGGSFEETGDTTCVPDCCWGYHTAVVVAALVLAKTLGLTQPHVSGFVSIWPLVFWTQSEADVGRALARELSGWALGYEDPVRERVEARRDAAKE